MIKIVNIIGGLGNQMFQYAFALSLKEKCSNDQVFIDTSHFRYIFLRKLGPINMHNGYEVEQVFPNVTLKHANWKQLIKVSWYCPNFLLSRIVRKYMPARRCEYLQPVNQYFEYHPEVYGITEDTYFDGLWSSIHYYEPIKAQLQKAFAHPEPDEKNKNYIIDMEDSDSVGVHIRRGDYLQDPDFRGICELDYYKKGIAEIEKDGLKHTFYIFSNDMKWCQQNICPLLNKHDVVMVKENVGGKSCWDMHLMTHCKDLIIANSSFSWWAAFLNNRGGRIIAPSKWVNRDAQYDIWAEEWIKL